MNSICWPKIFHGNSTTVLQGFEASKRCVHLLLSSETGELFGDPDFGIKLKRYVFDQNNYILKDILIDELYSKLRIFCPQVILDRDNIEIYQEQNKLRARITCRNQQDFKLNVFDLILFDEEEQS